MSSCQDAVNIIVACKKITRAYTYTYTYIYILKKLVSIRCASIFVFSWFQVITNISRGPRYHGYHAYISIDMHAHTYKRTLMHGPLSMSGMENQKKRRINVWRTTQGETWSMNTMCYSARKHSSCLNMLESAYATMPDFQIMHPVFFFAVSFQKATAIVELGRRFFHGYAARCSASCTWRGQSASRFDWSRERTIKNAMAHLFVVNLASFLLSTAILNFETSSSALAFAASMSSDGFPRVSFTQGRRQGWGKAC